MSPPRRAVELRPLRPEFLTGGAGKRLQEDL